MADNSDSLRKLAEQRLTIDYEEEGRWRIAYHLERGAIISFNNRMCADQVKVQLRGMLAEFSSHLQPQAPALEEIKLTLMRCDILSNLKAIFDAIHKAIGQIEALQAQSGPQAGSEREREIEQLVGDVRAIQQDYQAAIDALRDWACRYPDASLRREYADLLADSSPKPEGK